MAKNTNVLSLSLDPQTEEKLKLQAAQKTNGNVSKLVREMLNKYLVAEDDVIPVIIKIPIQLRGDQEGLQKWLDVKSQVIVKALST